MSIAIQETTNSEFVKFLKQLYQERSLISLHSGQSLRLEYGKVYVACQGLIQLHTLHLDGKETMLGLVGPYMPFGYPLTTVDPYFATTLTSVQVLTLSMSEIESSQVMMSGMFVHLARRLQQTEAWLALLGQRLVADRLRSLLILLAEEFGQVEPQGVRLMIRLSHRQLASIIGSSRGTVTRLLGEFRNEGWLAIHQRQLILNPSVLD
jgi:CRP-like cAMP-binding protein